MALFIEQLKDIRGRTFDVDSNPLDGMWFDVKGWHTSVTSLEAATQTAATAGAASATAAATSETNSAASATASATSATTAAGSATTAANDAAVATAKAAEIVGVSATASSLSAGSTATASYNSSTGVITFGVPVGDQGEKGDPFVVNAQGLNAGRSAYDTQPTGFSYFATDVSLIYFKNSDTSADWSAGANFGKGDQGDTGNGISAIALTGTVGSVDTYRITYTDATFFDFDVTNGSVTSVAGKTGAVTLIKADVGLANVDNTSDASKPVSTAQQTALDLKANKANPIFTGLITEETTVSSLTLGANSSVQTYTATANFTIVDDLVDGESVTFIVTNGGFTPTYPTITWWESAEPTLGTTDKLFFEKIGATLWGSQVNSLA